MSEEHIAVRAPNHLGDCVMSVPLIRSLVNRHHQVTVLTAQMYAPLFQRIDGVRLLIFEDRALHGMGGALAVAKLARRHRIDRIFLLPTSFSSALSAWVAGIPLRVGYPTDGRGILLTEMRPESTEEKLLHRSEQYLRVAFMQDIHSPGLTVHQLSTMAGLEVSGTERSRIRTRLQDHGISGIQKYAVLPFRAVAESRRWGKENYLALGKWLIRQFGFRIVLVGTGADREEGDWLQSQIGADALNVAGTTNIGELIALMAEASLVVGNDSGPCHVAAAVGTPLVVLSGADDPHVTSPLSMKKIVVRAESVGCLGCVRNSCPKTGKDHMRCMRELSMQSVQHAVQRILA